MNGKLMVREGKGAKDRTLWIGEELLGELWEWMDRRPESDYLLPTRKGTQVATSHLRRSVKRYARDAGIEEVERVSPHTLRHTFATRLYRDTGKIRMVQKAEEGKQIGRPSKFDRYKDDLEAMLEEGCSKAEMKRRTGLGRADKWKFRLTATATTPSSRPSAALPCSYVRSFHTEWQFADSV